MEHFFESEKEYNRKMLFYFSNIYMLFHIYNSYDYYQDNAMNIVLSTIPLYYLTKYLQLDQTDFENIQVFLTSTLFLYDLNNSFQE